MKSKYRRINLFGGPSTGKSRTNALLFSKLKDLGYNVEHVGEYCKAWAYQNKSIDKFSQVYVFGKQQYYEYRYLSNGVDLVTTDSPISLSYIYSMWYNNLNIAWALLDLVREYDKEFKPLNILLRRSDRPYNPNGRYQTEEEAIKLDSYMFNLVENIFVDNVYYVDSGDVDSIIALL